MPKTASRAPSNMMPPRKILPRNHVMSDDPSLPFRTFSYHVPTSGHDPKRSKGHMDDALHAARTQGLHDLPRSVKHAPPELRPAIRRRQNNEASKRSRDKQRNEMQLMEKKYNENEMRLKSLEMKVEELSAELSPKLHRKTSFYGEPF